MDAFRPDKAAEYRQQAERIAPLLSRSRCSKPSFTCSRRPSSLSNWRRTRIADRPPQRTANFA